MAGAEAMPCREAGEDNPVHLLLRGAAGRPGYYYFLAADIKACRPDRPAIALPKPRARNEHAFPHLLEFFDDKGSSHTSPNAQRGQAELHIVPFFHFIK